MKSVATGRTTACLAAYHSHDKRYKSAQQQINAVRSQPRRAFIHIYQALGFLVNEFATYLYST